MKNVLKTLAVFLLLSFPLAANGVPITYYDLDFEDSTFGGGQINFGSPTVVDSIYLDGKALEFNLNDQMKWSRNAADSGTHYVGFDYYAEPGANITQFLDVPSILRLDSNLVGVHHVDVYYDFAAESAMAYLDGTLSNDLLTILAWPAFSPSSNGVRIANQTAPPGYSEGIFQIDNFIWQGNTVIDDPAQDNSVPEPTTLLLFGTGLTGLLGYRSRQKKS